MIRTYDPFREFDRLVGRTFGGATRTAGVEALRFDDRVEVAFDLPGVDPDSIDLSVEKRELTLVAERPGVPEGAKVVYGSRPHGTVRRQVFLAEGLDTDALAASYENGVLTVSIPVAAQAQRRKVEIGVGAPAIESTATE